MNKVSRRFPSIFSDQDVSRYGRISAEFENLSSELWALNSVYFPSTKQQQLMALRALCPTGKIRGLGSRTQAGAPLLSAIMDAYRKDPRNSRSLGSYGLSRFSKWAECIQAAVDELAHMKKWSILNQPPHPAENRVLHFHYLVADFPAFLPLAVDLHRGVIAKLDQLLEAGIKRYDRLLGNALSPVIHIVQCLPASAFTKSVLMALPDSIEAIVADQILSLPRRRGNGVKGAAYARSTLRTYWNNWHSIFHATARNRAFQPLGHFRRRPTLRPVDQIGEYEEESNSANVLSARAYYAAMLRREEAEIATGRRRPGPVPVRKAGSGERLSPAVAIVQKALSPSMPGTLPITVLRMIDQWLINS